MAVPTPPKPTPPGKPNKPGEAISQEVIVHHVSQRKKRASGGPKQLNMTSMIDVVFLLLIYFIITASFSVGEGVITAQFPVGTGDADPLDPPKNPIKILVTTNGTSGCRIEVEQASTAPISFTQLKQLLEQMREGAFSDETPIIIQPGGQVRWQHVVNAFNAALAARFKNIAFAQSGGG